MEKNKASYEELAQENKQLKEQLDAIENSKKFQKKAAVWTLRKGAGVFLGKDLKATIKETITEFNTEKKVSAETASNLGAHIIWRITRIGIFAVIVAILPTLFLIIQTVYLGKQNDKIGRQNELITSQNARLEQQTYLQEAERRSSLVFLTNNVLDKMDEELRNTEKNKERNLSPQLIGRIVALSRSLKPYKFLENDSLSITISPERGQLLVNLIKAKLGEETYVEIFNDADFSYAELSNLTFESINFSNINLSHSVIENVRFLYCQFMGARFSKSYIEGVNFEFCFANYMDFTKSFIESVTFKEFTIEKLEMEYALVNEFHFYDSFVFYLSFYQSLINKINLIDVYADYFQLILNDGQLKEFLKSEVPEKYSLWTSLNIKNDFDFTISPSQMIIFSFDNLISENAIQKMDGVFHRNFKTVKILSKRKEEVFDMLIGTKDFTKKRDSLSITYINENNEISRENIISRSKIKYEDDISSFHESEKYGLELAKKMHEMRKYLLTNYKSSRRIIEEVNYRFSLNEEKYRNFLKQQENLNKH